MYFTFLSFAVWLIVKISQLQGHCWSRNMHIIMNLQLGETGFRNWILNVFRLMMIANAGKRIQIQFAFVDVYNVHTEFDVSIC